MDAIRTAIKFEDTRNTIKKFFGNEYELKVKDYIRNIKLVMENEKLSATKALLKISEMPHYQENGMIQALYISAAYEIILEK